MMNERQLDSYHSSFRIHRSSFRGARRLRGVAVGRELHLVAFGRDAHGLAGQNLAAQELRRERVLNHRLYRALQGARAVERVVALAREQGLSRVVQLYAHVALREQAAQPFELYLDDADDLLARELVEDDYVVHAV